MTRTRPIQKFAAAVSRCSPEVSSFSWHHPDPMSRPFSLHIWKVYCCRLQLCPQGQMLEGVS
ncbi:hypothetical protein CPLU01_06600 [Colletotrichum plurivorum]|uniref:Uncharacterized protein n=1 Tax=Colletotrichum plurivorum TaxID=2175906 RepID=A0A8H6KI00_9PEZI|nr:hypothetical protein CPLU01_06600 [Colletotrichum plurivorum]